MAPRQLPPLLDYNAPEFVSNSMTPTWRKFWVNLLSYLSGTPNGANLQASTSYADDAAAAAGGVPVGGWYRNGSVIQVRIS